MKNIYFNVEILLLLMTIWLLVKLLLLSALQCCNTSRLCKMALSPRLLHPDSPLIRRAEKEDRVSGGRHALMLTYSEMKGRQFCVRTRIPSSKAKGTGGKVK